MTLFVNLFAVINVFFYASGAISKIYCSLGILLFSVPLTIYPGIVAICIRKFSSNFSEFIYFTANGLTYF